MIIGNKFKVHEKLLKIGSKFRNPGQPIMTLATILDLLIKSNF